MIFQKMTQGCFFASIPFQNSGIYHLLLRLETPKRIGIGRLGRKEFPSGYYIYTGSAKRNLAKRLERHLKKKKTLHWHIDYLTLVGKIVEILVYPSGGMTECERANIMINLSRGEIIVPRFGSSDCRCPAHLVYIQKRPSLLFR